MSYAIKPVRRQPPSTLVPYLGSWQSNNSTEDLGIVRFAFQILSHAFDQKFGLAKWHRVALYDFLAYEEGMTKEDRAFVTATYREGSKTTWFAYAVPLYFMLIGQYGIYHKDILLPESRYIVIRCKTGKEAKKRLLNISHTLNRPIVKNIFGDLRPTYRQTKDKEAKDVSDLLILANGYVFEAVGMGQPIRGANLFGLRPSVIYDDPEHLENTKTPDRREANELDLYEESFGAVPVDGFMYYIGNKVHVEDLLGKLLNNKTWRRQFHTLTYIDENGVERPDWIEKYPMKIVEKRKRFYLASPKLGKKAYYKNFYNKIIADESYEIKYHNAEYVRAYGHNWLVFDTPLGKIYHNVKIVVACDPAISLKKGSDDTAISVVAFDSIKFKEGTYTPKRRFLLECLVGKYDVGDRYATNAPRALVVAVTPNELVHVERRGSPEEAIRLIVKYHADGVVFEIGGQQQTFFNQLVDLLDRMGIFLPKMPYPPGGISKEDRLKAGLMCYFAHGLIYFRPDMGIAISEVTTFPDSGLHVLDSMYLAEQLADFIPRIEYNPLCAPGTFSKDSYKSEEENLVSAEGLLNDYESWITH
uniref:Putative terminase n=1 Tax=viral metagenome TaxID=1070528 RepID=A0A6H1ZH15_9ZZZZ